MKNNKSGFSFIELMTVIGVLGVLVAIALPQYVGYLKAAKFMNFRIQADTLIQAEQNYYILNDRFYPDGTDENSSGTVNIPAGERVNLGSLKLEYSEQNIYDISITAKQQENGTQYLQIVFRTNSDFNENNLEDIIVYTKQMRNDAIVFSDYVWLQ